MVPQDEFLDNTNPPYFNGAFNLVAVGDFPLITGFP